MSGIMPGQHPSGATRILTGERINTLEIILSADPRFAADPNDFYDALKRNELDYDLVLQDLQRATYYHRLVFAYGIGQIFNDSELAFEIAPLPYEVLLAEFPEPRFEKLQHMVQFPPGNPKSWVQTAPKRFTALVNSTILNEQNPGDGGTVPPEFRYLTEKRVPVLKIILSADPGFMANPSAFYEAVKRRQPNFDLILQDLKDTSYHNRTDFAYGIGDIFNDSIEAAEEIALLDSASLRNLTEDRNLQPYGKFMDFQTEEDYNAWMHSTPGRLTALLNRTTGPPGTQYITKKRVNVLRVILKPDAGFQNDSTAFEAAGKKHFPNFDLMLQDLKDTSYYNRTDFAYGIGDIFNDSIEAAEEIAQLDSASLRNLTKDHNLYPYGKFMDFQTEEEFNTWMLSAAGELDALLNRTIDQTDDSGGDVTNPPKSRKITDARLGVMRAIITNDADYLEFLDSMEKNNRDYDLILNDLKNTSYCNRIVFGYGIAILFNDNYRAASEISWLDAVGLDALGKSGHIVSYGRYLEFPSEESSKAWYSSAPKRFSKLVKLTTQGEQWEGTAPPVFRKLTNDRIQILRIMLSDNAGFMRDQENYWAAVEKNAPNFDLVLQDLKQASYYNRLTFAYEIGDIFKDSPDAAWEIAQLDYAGLVELANSDLQSLVRFYNFSSYQAESWRSSASIRFSELIRSMVSDEELEAEDPEDISRDEPLGEEPIPGVIRMLTEKRLKVLQIILNAKKVDGDNFSAFSSAVKRYSPNFDLILQDLKHVSYYGRVIFGYQIGDIFNDNIQATMQVIDSDFMTLKEVAGSNLESYRDNFNFPSAEAAAAWKTSAWNKLFHLEPSATLTSMIQTQELQVNEPLRSGVLKFFQNQPNFNIREVSVNTAANAPDAFEDITNSEEVLDFLRKLQRTQALTPTPSAVPILMDKGFTSAVGVAFLSLKNFVSAVGPDISSHVATIIHGRAVRILNRNESAMTRLLQAIQGTKIAALDGNDTAQDRIRIINKLGGGKFQNINMTTLFGDMDSNPCDDCNSVTSPAAYFVEILEFLRSNNLKAGNEGKPNLTGIEGTVLEHLFARRPDLGNLQLTCPNTNAVLPYLDLANEVMESFVVHLDEHIMGLFSTEMPPKVQTKIDVYNTSDTDGELLSEPQHTNTKAYSILSNKIYPFNKLPYDQALDEVRTFLKYLGTSRYELLETYRATIGGSTSTTEGRALIAEYLNLSQAEYVALTGQAFEEERVELKEWEYWGYPSEEAILDPRDSSRSELSYVDEFLPRSGMELPDLVELLKTSFINPSLARRDAILIFPGTVYQYFRPTLKRVDTALTLGDYARIRHFLHLQQKLGWTTRELDTAILASSPPRTRPIINQDLLGQLVAIVKLLEITRLERSLLLTFWSPIGVQGDDSLYSRLFLTPHITGIDPIFRADDEGNYLSSGATISQHEIVVLATLGLTHDGLHAIRRGKMIGDELSIAHLTTLYRHSLMAKFLHVTPSVLFQVIGVFGDPFASPTCCLEFLDLWKRMNDARFSFAQLNFILHGIDDPLKPLFPSNLKIKTTIQSLLNGQAAHPKIEGTKEEEEAKYKFQEGLVTDLILTTVSGLFSLSNETTMILLLEIQVGGMTALEVFRSIENTLYELKVLIFRHLARAAMLIKGFLFSDDEVQYVMGNSTILPGLNDDTLSLGSWKRLSSYVDLRNSLPKTIDRPLSDFFHHPPDAETLSRRISGLLLVNQETVDRVLARFGFQKPEYFVDEMVLTRLKKACDFAGKVAVDIDRIFSWADPLADFRQTRQVAIEIRGSIRAKSTAEDWPSIFKPLRDRLRNNQREALIGYLLVQPKLRAWGVVDADSLFEFFLIDVQMGPCLETSRIKQAISSVQLFIQRCLCGLEARYGVENHEVDRKRWEWMQKYRVWEANRKVFLYPENWIEPSLRDDKSPFFQEFEADLSQRDLNSQSIQDAVKSYVSRVDEVANLRVVALYVEEDKSAVVPATQQQSERLQGSAAITGRLQLEQATPDDNQDPPQRSQGALMRMDSDGSDWDFDDSDWDGWEPFPGLHFPHWPIRPPSPVIDPPVEPKPVAKTGGLVHIFARSRAAPFAYYYRMYDWTANEWKPWEKMEIDVQNHEEPTAAEHGGAFLIPVVVEGRLIVFTPQITKHVTQTEQVDGNPLIIHHDWEIKLGWTEHRNGKWTAKKLSSAALLTGIERVSALKFQSSFTSSGEVEIAVGRAALGASGRAPVGLFNFSGGRVSATPTISDAANTLPESPSEFNAEVNGKSNITVHITHLGISGYEDLATNSGASPTTITFGPGENRSKPLYHRFSGKLLTHTTASSTLTDIYTTLALVDPALIAPHELQEPYALYNWEMGLHAPMLLIEQLSNSHQYDKALEIARYVFDPLCSGSDAGRVWKWAPFKNISVEGDVKAILGSLLANVSDSRINHWRDSPFQPHVVARDRPISYMKWIVMKYISILIASGDQLFRQNTLESVPLAIQYYTMAAHLYGPPGHVVVTSKKKAPKTFNSLLLKLDAFSNAMVEFETAFPFVHLYDPQTSRPISRYFCVPDNPKLRELRATIDDRLYKIRHCQDINGNEIHLALFEPPIDPGALVRAAAQGLSLTNVMQHLGGPMPNYRFRYLLQKAFEMVHELRSLGEAFLVAKEKKDSQSYEIIRIGHESTINGLLMDMKKLNCDEANKTLDSLRQARNGPLSRLKHFAQLLGEDATKFSADTMSFDEIDSKIEKPSTEGSLVLTADEKNEVNNAIVAAAMRAVSKGTESVAAGVLVFPTPEAHGEPFGVGVSTQIGPKNISEGIRAAALALGAVADTFEAVSGNASRKAGLIRQFQDRVLQANSAGHDLENINAQIQAQQIRVSMALKDIEIQQKQIDSTSATQEFLRSKYTNEALYTWQETQLRTLYYQTYTLTYDLAQKVEKSYQFERGLTATNFIQESWDANRDGLFSAEALGLGLKRLEAAHQEGRGYDYEITKHVSLRQVNPRAFLNLRQLGKCSFSVSEKQFDMDFPGHYNRRIKSVSLSIPCVVGPYTSINCTLNLTSHAYRVSNRSGDYGTENDKLKPDIVPIHSIAVSSGQNDSGVFELNFHDERYVPFEGAGAISNWQLELPSLRAFDYRTITDAILHIRYTSIFGGNDLQTTATASYWTSLADSTGDEGGLFAVFDLKNQFANEWYRFGKDRPLELSNLNERLPYFTKDKSPSPNKIEIYASDSEFTLNSMPDDVPIPLSGGQSLQGMKVSSTGDANLTGWSWKLKTTEKLNPQGELWMVVRYTLTQPPAH